MLLGRRFLSIKDNPDKKEQRVAQWITKTKKPTISFGAPIL